MKESAVVTQDIVKDFPSGDTRLRVLNGIDFSAAKGEMTMIVGPSGCGKTTLLSIITGILTPTRGTVTVNGTEITRLRDGEKVRFRRRELGFIFQQYNLLNALTAAENAAVPLVAAGVPLKKATQKAKAVLEGIGMTEHSDKLPSQLSGGQQQRVAIARSIVHNPRLIVCDEPTAALDASAGQTVMEILKSIALENDRAVIVVTHDNRIFQFADCMVGMSDGIIVRDCRQTGEQS